jgi:ABC-type multidrug transport system fused ATPase/permease subunit
MARIKSISVGYALRSHGGWIIAGTIAAIVVSLTNYVFPWTEKLLIDNVFGSKDYGMVGEVAGLAVAAAVITVVLRAFQTLAFQIAAQSVSLDAAVETLQVFVGAMSRDLEALGSGNLLAVFSNDLPSASGVSITYAEIVRRVIELSVGVAIVVRLSWQMTLLSLPIVGMQLLLPTLTGKGIRHWSRTLQDRSAALTSATSDSVQGLREIKLLNAIQERTDLLKQQTDTVNQARVRLAVHQAYGSSSFALFWLTIALIYLVGVQAVLHNKMTLGELVAMACWTPRFGR